MGKVFHKQNPRLEQSAGKEENLHFFDLCTPTHRLLFQTAQRGWDDPDKQCLLVMKTDFAYWMVKASGLTI